MTPPERVTCFAAQPRVAADRLTGEEHSNDVVAERGPLPADDDGSSFAQDIHGQETRGVNDATECCRYHRGMAYRDLPASERRLLLWQLTGVGVLMVGVGVLVWAAVLYYQAASVG